MVSKIDGFCVHVLSLDDDEVRAIISALNEVGETDLADEIDGECFGDDGCDCMPIKVDSSQVEIATERLDRLGKAAEYAASAQVRLGKVMS